MRLEDGFEHRRGRASSAGLGRFRGRAGSGTGPSRTSPGSRRHADRSSEPRPVGLSRLVGRPRARTLGSPLSASLRAGCVSAVRISRGSEAGSRPNGTARPSMLMSSVVECSIRKSGSSVQKSPQLREPPGLEETARLGVDQPGTAPAGWWRSPRRMPSFQIRSAHGIPAFGRSRSTSSRLASRAAARRPATTQAFE